MANDPRPEKTRIRRPAADTDLNRLTERTAQVEREGGLATADARPTRLTVQEREYRAIVYDLERHAARGQGLRTDRAVMATAARALRDLLGMDLDEPLLPKDRKVPAKEPRTAAAAATP